MLKDVYRHKLVPEVEDKKVLMYIDFIRIAKSEYAYDYCALKEAYKEAYLCNGDLKDIANVLLYFVKDLPGFDVASFVTELPTTEWSFSKNIRDIFYSDIIKKCMSIIRYMDVDDKLRKELENID